MSLLCSYRHLSNFRRPSVHSFVTYYLPLSTSKYYGSHIFVYSKLRALILIDMSCACNLTEDQWEGGLRAELNYLLQSKLEAEHQSQSLRRKRERSESLFNSLMVGSEIRARHFYDGSSIMPQVLGRVYGSLIHNEEQRRRLTRCEVQGEEDTERALLEARIIDIDDKIQKIQRKLAYLKEQRQQRQKR
jgi:hypothetical protein